jgi:hypothetical protein
MRTRTPHAASLMSYDIVDAGPLIHALTIYLGQCIQPRVLHVPGSHTGYWQAASLIRRDGLALQHGRYDRAGVPQGTGAAGLFACDQSPKIARSCMVVARKMLKHFRPQLTRFREMIQSLGTTRLESATINMVEPIGQISETDEQFRTHGPPLH